MEPGSNAGAHGVQASTSGQLLIPEPGDDGSTARGFGWSESLPHTHALHARAAQAAVAATTTVLLQTDTVVVVADAVVKGSAYNF